MLTSDLPFICISRHRADLLRKCTLRLFPSVTVCIGEDERDDYWPVTKNLLLHPPDITGIGPVRQWVLDHIDSPAVVIMPDDITVCYGLVSYHNRRITNTSDIEFLVRNTVECAEAAGARLCGFNVTVEGRKFRPYNPFGLYGWVDGPIGIIGRDIRFDPNLLLHPDIDYLLQHLRRFRMVWQDLRYGFDHDRFQKSGGNALHRSREQHEREFAYLKRKWGKHISVSWVKNTFLTKVHVTRRQPQVIV